LRTRILRKLQKSEWGKREKDNNYYLEQGPEAQEKETERKISVSRLYWGSGPQSCPIVCYHDETDLGESSIFLKGIRST